MVEIDQGYLDYMEPCFKKSGKRGKVEEERRGVRRIAQLGLRFIFRECSKWAQNYGLDVLFGIGKAGALHSQCKVFSPQTIFISYMCLYLSVHLSPGAYGGQKRAQVSWGRGSS